MLPFIFTIYVSVDNSIHGVGFITTKIIGAEAIFMTLVLIFGFFWWVFAIAVVGIVVSVIRISKLRKKMDECCPQCGGARKPSDNFCHNCGYNYFSNKGNL